MLAVPDPRSVAEPSRELNSMLAGSLPLPGSPPLRSPASLYLTSWSTDRFRIMPGRQDHRFRVRRESRAGNRLRVEDLAGSCFVSAASCTPPAMVAEGASSRTLSKQVHNTACIPPSSRPRCSSATGDQVVAPRSQSRGQCSIPEPVLHRWAFTSPKVGQKINQTRRVAAWDANHAPACTQSQQVVTRMSSLEIEYQEPGNATGLVSNESNTFPEVQPGSDYTPLIKDLLSWCRQQKVAPVSQSAVPGPNSAERSQLAALGGVAKALSTRAATNADALPPTVKAWMEQAPKLPDRLATRLEDLLRDSNPDPLAEAYQRIVSGPRRRALGTFFTPASVSSYMKNLVLLKGLSPDVVADPGAGVGAFSDSALKVWDSSKVHAVDVNAVTLGLLAARPALLQELGSRLFLHHVDFLAWISQQWPSQMGSGLIWGNPPYTRHQELSTEAKKLAREATGGLMPGARAGLSTYFLAASLLALRDHDALCLLLPANWLESDYAQPIRRHLWSLTSRQIELHMFPRSLQLFPAARVSAMVLWVSPLNSAEPHFVAHDLIEDLAGFRNHGSLKWDRKLNLPSTFVAERIRMQRNDLDRPTVPLGQIAVVRRGIATGANKFFLRTDAEVAELPVGAYLPAATRLRDLPSDTLDESAHEALGKAGGRRWILRLREEDIKEPSIGHLVADGELNSMHKRYLCQARKFWYVLETMPVPDLLIGPMGKDRFRIVSNPVGALPTNTLYAIRLRERPALKSKVELLASWLRSAEGQWALSSAARQHGLGVLKLEPRDLLNTPLPTWLSERLEE